MRTVTLILILLTLPGPLRAQGAGESSRARATATGSFMVKGSTIAGADRLFVGGGVALVLGGRLAIGGAGHGLTQNVELEDSGFDLGLGYGGLTLRYLAPLSSRTTLESGFLLGAGHAEVNSLVTQVEVGSDNFTVAEPEVTLTVAPHHRLHIGLSVGYRMVWGVEDLPRVAEEDIRSFTTSFLLRFRGG
jgi:hypothetical protein